MDPAFLAKVKRVVPE